MENEMLQILNPTYTFKVTITNNNAWNDLDAKSGCDEIWIAIKNALHARGLKAEVFLEKFEHRS